MFRIMKSEMLFKLSLLSSYIKQPYEIKSLKNILYQHFFISLPTERVKYSEDGQIANNR